MVGYYPLCAFGENRVAASIDTALHAFLPFPRRSSAPGLGDCACRERQRQAGLDEFNKKYGRRIAWVPWRRPGFELALMLRKAVEATPGCDRIVLGARAVHVGRDAAGRILNSIKTIDQMGEFVQDHAKRAARPLFGGASATTRPAARRSSMGSCRFCAARSRRTGGSSRTTTARTTRSPSRTRRGAESLCRWARAAPIFLHLRTSRRSMCLSTRPATASQHEDAHRRAAREVSAGLRGVLRTRSPIRRRSATRIRRSW